MKEWMHEWINELTSFQEQDFMTKWNSIFGCVAQLLSLSLSVQKDQVILLIKFSHLLKNSDEKNWTPYLSLLLSLY